LSARRFPEGNVSGILQTPTNGGGLVQTNAVKGEGTNRFLSGVRFFGGTSSALLGHLSNKKTPQEFLRRS